MRRVRQWFDSLSHHMATSLKYRLVFLTMAAITVGAVLSSLFTYQAARVSLYTQLDQELTVIAEQAAQQLAVDMTTTSFTSADSLQASNVLVSIVNANTNNTALLGNEGTSLIITSAEVAVARVQSGSSARDGERQDGVAFRIVAVPFLTVDSGDPWAVVIGRDLAPTHATLDNLTALQWLISLTIIGLCLGTAIFIGNTALSPVTTLTTTITEMTRTDELRTIEVHGVSEVADLEKSFNSLVTSLNSSRERQNQLIADASHELRTPLTSLRTNVELLIADENSKMLPTGARGEILSDVATQIGEFTSLIGDLVALSRDIPLSSNLIPIDLASVIEKSVARAQRRRHGLTFDISLHSQYVLGDAAMLERAITNLLDNAVKFSPEGGTVTVRLDDEGLVISDQGPGVSEADMPHIFDRFYRANAARNTPGTGLGLSIVAHTVTSHGGSVAVQRSPEGGAMFTVVLPVVEPEED